MRIGRNRVFEEIAQTDMLTIGWFHGFKFHILIKDKGGILSFAITQATVDDREPLRNEAFLQDYSVLAKKARVMDYLFSFTKISVTENHYSNTALTAMHGTDNKRLTFSSTAS